MGGFEFGSVTHLDSTITLCTFIAVIAFVIFFDFIIGLMEYFLEGSNLYHRMIQMIYKELMLMGLVSFTVIMIDASQKVNSTPSEYYHKWILGIDFSHILLFYLTFFFVAHAFYLMRTSIKSSKGYRKTFCEKTADLIIELEAMETDWMRQFLFGLQYLPLSAIRERVEFHLAHSLFKETYQLPVDFNFASYLSGCFDRYALKTINRSMFTWFVLMVLGIVNYFRIQIGYGFHDCHEVKSDDGDGAHRRYLTDIGHHAADNSSASNSNSSHPITDDDSLHGSAHLVGANCMNMNVKFFVFCGLLLCIYTFIIVFIARVYKLRLVNRIGFKGPEDYLAFLQFAEEDIRNDGENRVTSAALKKEIDNVLDADEHSGGEEDEFREVGEFLSKTFTTLGEIFQDCVLAFKLAIISIINPSRVSKNTDAPAILSLKTDESTTSTPKNEYAGGLHGAMSPNNAEDGKDHEHSGIDDDGASVASDIEGEKFSSRKRIMSKLTSAVRGKSMRSFRQHSTIIQHTKKVSPLDSAAQSKDVGDKSDQSRDADDTVQSTSAPMLVGRKSITNRLSTLVHHRPYGEVEISKETPFLELLQNLQVRDVVEEQQSLVAAHSAHSSFRGEIAADSSHAAIVSDRRKQVRHTLMVKRHSQLDASSPVSSNNVSNNDMCSEESTSGKNIALIVPVAKGEKRRNSIHVKLPEQHTMSMIEKFNIEHPATKRGAHQGIDLRALNQVITNSKAKKNRSALHACWYQFVEWARIISHSCGALCRSNKVKEGDGATAEGHHKECDLSDDFSDIYFFGKPKWFFHAVELNIMFNCLYLALWVTNFIKIGAELDLSVGWHLISQACMAIPFFLVIPAIGFISETSSLLTAISELNLEVVQEVLVETEDTNVLLDELRRKMLERIGAIENAQNKPISKLDIIHGLFAEIDQDGSGSIDKIEFRVLLRALKLTYSDQRFKRLYRAVDSDGDNKIRRAELDQFLDPEKYRKEEAERKKAYAQFRKEKREAEQRLVAHSAADIIEDGTYTFDADGNTVFVAAVPNQAQRKQSAAEKMRSLSSISDYSDTDSEDNNRKSRIRALPKVDSVSHLDGEGDHSGHKSEDGNTGRVIHMTGDENV